MGSQVSTMKAVLVPDSSRRKSSKPEKGKIGILSFEVANVMSKIMLLWQSLSDHEIMRLRTDVVKAEGVLNLVSENEAVLLSLACMEKLQDLTSIAGAVARVGKRCQEPILNGFEHVYNDILKQNIDVGSWEYPLKDMEGKIKKMEQYIASTSNLYQELEILGDLEQAIRRMQDDGSGTPRDRETLVALEQKAAWHRQEIKYLRDLSLWNRAYDKIVILLARTVCTIHGRILNVFGSPLLKLPQLCPVERLKDGYPSPLTLPGPYSKFPNRRGLDIPASHAAAATNASLLPSAGSHDRTHGIGMSATVPALPSSTSTSRVSPVVSDIRPSPAQALASGPMITNSKQSYACYFPLYGECLQAPNKGSVDFSQPFDVDNTPSILNDKVEGPWTRNAQGGIPNGGPGNSHSYVSAAQMIEMKSPRTSAVDLQPRKTAAIDRPRRSTVDQLQSDVFGQTGQTRKVYFDPKNRHLNAPTSTLGGAALAIHYANVIIIVEKMVKFPRLISHDSRDDLYHMLPNSVRMALRSRLKASNRGSVYGFDAGIAGDWKEALERILAWLTPLAHNMIRWQSEHNFEQQQCAARSNILLLQTLFFADLAKTEAAITELLVGLNYICGHEKERSSLSGEYDSQKEVDDYLELF
ncbi:hypothetical protein MPTK1_1g24740 [Marchantia polymorpha subsp. ruderalis]|uniref:DUF668 domain-containing protein n=2 Tax=Marchantia polymorpha TaxID=3197 RepID=A0AAF6ATX9_MARPO|nr:hypothetical protein MARPO_0061s0047 [Marchantia polymorpha]BBM99899.1 hypothetical protein Mp_1g24740 [Marchantia polymorpha subsp. ruderalis]|eukprot:PTQ36785.1 hypothetical protein MARPO_0061s0047 [Marchantia polymorpha]